MKGRMRKRERGKNEKKRGLKKLMKLPGTRIYMRFGEGASGLLEIWKDPSKNFPF